MTKKFYAKQSTGQVAIYEGGHDAALTAPHSNLNKVYFHSDLDYVGVSHIYEGVIQHPRRAVSGNADKYSNGNQSPTSGTQEWVLLTLPNIGYVRHAILTVNGEQLPGAAPVHRSGTASARYAMLRMTATQAILHERYHTFNSALDAISITYKLYVFTAPIVSNGQPLLMTPTRMVASGGKLDTSLRYIRSTPSNPAFQLVSGATADVRGGGLRIVTPKGTVINDGVYNGSFTGSTSKGCTI